MKDRSRIKGRSKALKNTKNISRRKSFRKHFLLCTTAILSIIASPSYTATQFITGASTINNMANTDILQATGNATAANNFTVNGSGTIDTNGFTIGLSGIVSDGGGAGSIVKTGSNTLTLSGNNTYSGGTTINAGTIKVSNTNALGSGGISVANNTTLQAGAAVTTANAITLDAGTATLHTNGHNWTLSGAITGGGNLTKDGSGTLIFDTVQKTYTGTTTIIGGKIVAGAANMLPSSSDFTLFLIYTLDLTAGDQTIGSLAGSGGTVSLGTSKLTLGGNNTSTIYSGIIEGAGTLIKEGTGIQTLSGNNTYSGGTTINAGGIGVGHTNALGSGGISMDNNTTLQAVASVATANSIAIANAANVNFDTQANSWTLSGAITGTASLTKQGSGTLTFNTVQKAYTGTTTISAGTLRAGATNMLPTSSAFSLANAAGVILNLNNSNQTIASLEGGGSTGGTISLGVGTLTLGGNNASTIYSGAISGMGGIIKEGSGTLTFDTVQKVYTGATIINGGILKAGAANILPSSSAFSLANVAGVVLDLNNFDQTIGSLTDGGSVGGTVSLGSATLTVGGNNTSKNFSGAITGTGGLTKEGSGTLTLLMVPKTYTGATIINGGTLKAGAANILPSSSAFTLNAGSALDITSGSQTIGSLTGVGTVSLDTRILTLGGNNINTTYSGVITGTGGLIKQGSGTWSVTGNNTGYTGTTTLSTGTLAVGHANALGSGGISLANNTTFQAGAAITTPNTIAIANAASVSFDTQAHAWALSGVISGIGSSITKIGTDILTLSGNNTYSGGTTISAGGMGVGHANALGSGSISMDNNTTLQAGAAVTTANDIAIANAASVSFDTQANGWTLSGDITGNGTTSFTKAGAGTLTLSGTNGGFTGTATVGAGTLAVNSAFGGSVSVSNGATLRGIGTIAGDVTGAGTVAPGQSPGMMTVNGDYTPVVGSTLLIAMQPGSNPPIAGTDYSKLVVTGTATLSNATLVLDAAGGTYTQGAQYTVVEAGNIVGTFANTTFTHTSPYQAKVSYTPTSAIVTLGLAPVAGGDGGAGGSTGDYINTLPTTPGSDLVEVVKTINVLPSSRQAQVLNSINPERNNRVGQASIENAPTINQINGIRLTTLRDFNYSGQSSASLGLKMQDTTLLQMLNGSAADPSTLTLGAMEASTYDNLQDQLQGTKGEGGFWVHTFGYVIHQQATTAQDGFKGKTGGVIVGMDHKVNQNVVMGAGLGLTQSLIRLDKDAGNSRIRSYYGTVYGSYNQAGWHVDISFTAALNRYQNTRRITLPQEIRMANSSHLGFEVAPHVTIGHELQVAKDTTLEPFMGVDCVLQREQGYSETGAASLSNQIKGKTSALLRSEAGITVHHSIAMDEEDTLILRPKLSYVHKKGWKTSKMTANFVGQSQGFMIEGSQQARQQLSPGFEAEYRQPDQYILLRYNGEFDRRSKSHEIMLKYGKRF
jgi:autotransporter-associated beta strand protein